MKPTNTQTAPTACKCGCGNSAKAGREFIYGHWSRTPEAKAIHLARRKSKEEPNPSGLCQCGCGTPTPIASRSKYSQGYGAGQHTRFVKGHGQRPLKGPKNAAWRGGRVVMTSGYVLLYAPDHPHASKGYVPEHRVVVEKRLGRILDRGERVHHLNHVRGDNRDENLILFPSHSAHIQAEHRNSLNDWHQRNPEKSRALKSTAGKSGADKRWKKKA